MLFENILLLLPALFNFLFAGFVYLKNKNSRINISYCLCISLVGLWALLSALFHINQRKGIDLILLKCDYFIGSFIAPFFFIFTHILVKNKILSRKNIIILFLPNLLFFYLYFFTPLMLSGLSYNADNKMYLYGPLHYLFDIQTISLFVLSFGSLFNAYKRASGTFKLQLKYVALGTLISAVLVGTTNLILPDFFKNFSYNRIGPFFTLPMFLFIGYAIVTHRLMDINIVIRKTAIYSLLASTITVVYFLVVYTLETLFRGVIGYKSITWALIVIAIFTLIFQPLKNLIQSFLDRYFFKGTHSALEEELKKAQEELKRAERLKAVGTLAAGMAHEIKNPLTSIKTFTEYLPIKYKDPTFIDKFYKIVSAEVNNINDIVQQLLDFSKPKPLKLQSYDIHNLIDKTLAFLNNDFLKHNIKVETRFNKDIPPINIDPNQMQQVFLNIFLNAIDAMKKGGQLIITTNLEVNMLEIEVKDTGKGMTKKELEHIFDPFFSTKETGTGLGMSIVYGIIKEHKGHISVYSEVNKGTGFTISIPFNNKISL